MSLEHNCDTTNCRNEADDCHCRKCFDSLIDQANEEGYKQGKSEGYTEGFEAGKAEFHNSHH